MTLFASRFPEKGLSEFGVCTAVSFQRIPKSCNHIFRSVHCTNHLDDRDVVQICMASAVRVAAGGTLRRGLLQGKLSRNLPKLLDLY